MTKHLLRYSILFVIVLILTPLQSRGADLPSITQDISELLAQVDSTLTITTQLCKAKEDRMSLLRNKYKTCKIPEQCYYIARDLYSEYSTYDSDSAMYYANEGMKLSQKLGREEWRYESLLNKSYLYSATGLLDVAKACLDSIEPKRLGPNQLVQYCDRKLFIDTRMAQYLGDRPDTIPPYSLEIDSLLQEACKHLQPDDIEYAWFVGWTHCINKQTAEKAIPSIQAIVESTTVDTRPAAMNAWVLSRLYEYAGKPDLRLKYLLHSALIDIRMSNKEIASLEEAAWILYQLGDLDHAQRYFEYSINCANEYKSRVRLMRLGIQQEQVLASINARSQLEMRQSNRFALLMALMLVFTIGAFLFMWRQRRQLTMSREALSKANIELSERVDELQQMRARLAQANDDLSQAYEDSRQSTRELAQINEQREQYIASVFGLCSNYINKLDDFRKNIYHMIVARRFDDVSKITKTPELPQSEVKELYANFDSIFLQIYPNFVEDFNSLLKPEERITLRSGERLNTELRIYALVRLGLNDSVKIAQFLHCSVQTVYNTRLRTRNKAIIPKEEFAKTVARLGKLQF